MATLKELEGRSDGTIVSLEEILNQLKFNEAGLIPAIAQDHLSKDVLMLAWMDRTAIKKTLEEGYVTYFSRSRQSYWKKGETSGHVQRLVQMSFDCDGDAVLIEVEQTGTACHTMRKTCFYLKVNGLNVSIASKT